MTPQEASQRISELEAENKQITQRAGIVRVALTDEWKIIHDELIAELEDWKSKKQIVSELFEAACSDLGDTQAELARVKAESLRVVPVGEPVNIWVCNSLFIQHGDTIYTRPHDDIKKDGWWESVCDGSKLKDHVINGVYVEKLCVQPLRLERWEDSHE